MELSKAQQIALQLMKQHGLIAAGWRFEFDNARRRFGCCRYGSRRITLSTHLAALNSEAQVTDTILHEIAHALVPPGHGHDYVWRRKAQEIGCTGDRCYSSDQVVTPEANYVAICPGCGGTFKRHRMTAKSFIRNQSCANCSGGRYNPEFKLVWKKNPKKVLEY